MRLKIDAFTWAVIAIVVLLVAAAVLTVNLADGSTADQRIQLPADSPGAPVVAALLAVQDGDVATARAQFTDEVLEQYKKNGYDPIANAASFAANDQSSRRMRIVEVSQPQADQEAAEVAFVTIAEDNFSGGGLFGRSTWSNQRVLRVVRVDGDWKIDDTNLFY
ncbi:MAG: hypothetical protein ACRC1H_20355 [Caldilineaceae bacterium]